jgi:hypothetical protein
LLTGEIKISKLEVRSKVIFGSLCKPAWRLSQYKSATSQAFERILIMSGVNGMHFYNDICKDFWIPSYCVMFYLSHKSHCWFEFKVRAYETKQLIAFNLLTFRETGISVIVNIFVFLFHKSYKSRPIQPDVEVELLALFILNHGVQISSLCLITCCRDSGFKWLNLFPWGKTENADRNGMKHEPPSPAQTLGSWVRIPLKAWMSVCAYSVFMLSCVHVAALRQADPPSKESYSLCKMSRN